MSIVDDRGEQRVEQELIRFLSDRALVPDPWPLYAALREQTPIRRCGGITLITRYAHVNALFRDPRLSRHEAAILESQAAGPVPGAKRHRGLPAFAPAHPHRGARYKTTNVRALKSLRVRVCG